MIEPCDLDLTTLLAPTHQSDSGSLCGSAVVENHRIILREAQQTDRACHFSLPPSPAPEVAEL